MAIVAFLLALTAYAAFAQGATSLGRQAVVQTAVALAVTIAAAVWLWHGTPQLSAPRLAWIGLGMLGAFALWSCLSLAWSVAPDRTLLEANRAFTYVLTAGLGLAAASWWRHAASRLAIGYLAIAGVIALYALGGKIAPGLHLDGLIDLDNASFLPRLRAPLDYWNALGLALLLAMPIAAAVAMDRTRTTAARLTALGCAQVLILALGLTYSRGGVIAVVVGLVVFAALSRRGLMMTVVIAMAAAAAVPPLLFAFTTHSMTALNQPLGDREGDGLVLGAILVASLVGLLLAGRPVLRAEDRLKLSPAASRRLALAGAAAAMLAVFGGGVALAASERGFSGSISHEWASFRKVRRDPVLDPRHLIATNSGNRWTWWSEAAGAWSDRPLQGWGAGSFPVVHREYRTNELEVLQPHSVPMQLLSETGLTGAILALGGMAALVLLGVRHARGAPSDASHRVEDGERLLLAALASAVCAWLFHGLYDWDLDIPGVTIPAMAFMGVLAGRMRPSPAPQEARDTPVRVSALAGLTVAMSAVALLSIFPAWAESKANGALTRVGGARPSAADRRQAARAAELASRLDPLATKPLLALASIQQGQGDLQGSKAALRRAARRQPEDSTVWFELATLGVAQRDVPAVRTALRRALALNPQGTTVRILAVTVQTPIPNRSATAVRTPLASSAVAGAGL
ncbi:MAG: O-antigen ligase family protein [Actinomycetota bacterium]|nr:O-antigen ligase family protein [Actinomycetota bacterium]